MSSPSLLVWSGVYSITLKDAYGFGLQVDLESNFEKHHYQHDDRGLLSLKVPLSKNDMIGVAPRLRQVVALFCFAQC